MPSNNVDNKHIFLDKENKEVLDGGQGSSAEVDFERCRHDLELISSTEARCKKCPVGYTGPNVVLLVDAFKRN